MAVFVIDSRWLKNEIRGLEVALTNSKNTVLDVAKIETELSIFTLIKNSATYYTEEDLADTIKKTHETNEV